MTKLLDTNVFLWLISDSPQLTSTAQAALTEPNSQLCLSLASIWEIAIKVGIGKLKLPEPLNAFLAAQLRENAIRLLPVRYDDVIAAGLLPLYHRDPFDRLLVAQALSENLPLLSSDAHFDAYGIKRIW